MSELAVFDEGVHQDVPERVYHADCAPEPSLSSTIAKVIINRSARAAAWKHPRLRPASAPPAPPEEYDAKRAFGTVVHKMVLGRGKDVVSIDAADFKSGAAKAARDAALADGAVPIIAAKLADAEIIAGELRERVDYADCPTELVLVWRDKATDGTPVWCRAMLDALDIEGPRIDDLKLTQGELSEVFVARQIASMSYDLSAAFYRRGLAHLQPRLTGRIKNRLVFGEARESFDVFAVDLKESDLHVADRKVQSAIDTFARCLATGDWPGVAPQPRAVALPPWHARAWLDTELGQEIAA